MLRYLIIFAIAYVSDKSYNNFQYNYCIEHATVVKENAKNARILANILPFTPLEEVSTS